MCEIGKVEGNHLHSITAYWKALFKWRSFPSDQAHMLTRTYLVKMFGGDQMEMESLKESHPRSDKILKLKAIENRSPIIKRVPMLPFRNILIVQDKRRMFISSTATWE